MKDSVTTIYVAIILMLAAIPVLAAEKKEVLPFITSCQNNSFDSDTYCWHQMHFIIDGKCLDAVVQFSFHHDRNNMAEHEKMLDQNFKTIPKSEDGFCQVEDHRY